MGLFEILVLFMIMAALALTPSASVALVVARTSTGGLPSGGAVAAGIVLGDLVFVGLAILGMTALAEAMGGLFLVMRYLAAAYLIWFGIGLLRSQPARPAASSSRSASTLSASFLSGLLLTLGDIKAIFFYASLFPAFVDLAAIGAPDIAIIVALTVVAVGGVKLGYAYFSDMVLSGMGELKSFRTIKLTAGGLMMGLGAYLFARP
ncbi:MAG: LysE family translocator [Pseudomonas sp.]|mgnify:CR=1 FL=1|nr:LysE family translocator [Pseudomonas sp.]